MLDAGYWILDIQCPAVNLKMLDAGYWMLDTGCWMIRSLRYPALPEVFPDFSVNDFYFKTLTNMMKSDAHEILEMIRKMLNFLPFSGVLSSVSWANS